MCRFLFLILLVIFVTRVNGQTIPSGFSTIQSEQGVTLYANNVNATTTEYVQVVDISAGAKLNFWLTAPTIIDNTCSTPTKRFTRSTLSAQWNQASSADSKTFSVSNAQFFNHFSSSTAVALAFGIKKDGVVDSPGYGSLCEFVGEKEMLELWSDRTDIKHYDDDTLSIYNSTAPNVLIGLDVFANKSSTSLTGRTFVGVLDGDLDGKKELILLYTSSKANQEMARNALSAFGVSTNDMMMLDGGGSTQMICKGQDYISATRTIPQGLAVVAGSTVSNPPILVLDSAMSYDASPMYVAKDYDFTVYLHNTTGTNWSGSLYLKVNGQSPSLDLGSWDVPAFGYRTVTYNYQPTLSQISSNNSYELLYQTNGVGSGVTVGEEDYANPISWTLKYGEPCPEINSITGIHYNNQSTIPGESFYASSFINSSSNLLTGVYYYSAKDSILLMSDFEVQTGVVFITDLIGCSN